MHILDNQHEYGKPEQILQLVKACQKEKVMNCWESLYIQTLQQQQHLLIDEQRTNDSNPLYSPGEHVTPQHTVLQQLSRHQTSAAITSKR